MLSIVEKTMKFLNLRDEWQLAHAACAWAGENDAVKIRWVHTALVRGAMPEVVRKFCEFTVGAK